MPPASRVGALRPRSGPAVRSASGRRAATAMLAFRLLYDDDAGHQRSMDGTLVVIGAGLGERERIDLAGPGHVCAAREGGRSEALHAVRGGARAPGPGDRLPHRHGVLRRIAGSVVCALEEDVAHGHRANGAAATTTAATVVAARAGAVAGAPDGGGRESGQQPGAGSTHVPSLNGAAPCPRSSTCTPPSCGP